MVVLRTRGQPRARQLEGCVLGTSLRCVHVVADMPSWMSRVIP
jgi:hypothetical protein